MIKKLSYKLNFVLFILSYVVFLYCNSHSLLSNDDITTMAKMRMPLGQMLRLLCTEDVHLPVYFILLKMWLSVFGVSVFMARFFSYAGILACAFVCGNMVKKLYGEKAALWTTVLFLFLPQSFVLIEMIRMYSWACFFCTAAFLSAQLALSKGEKKDFIFYAIYAVLGAWTHYYASLTCAMIALSFLFQSWKKDRKLFKKCVVYNAILFLLVCPEFYIFIHQPTEDVTWIKKEYGLEIWRYFLFDYGYKTFLERSSFYLMFFLWIVTFQFLLNRKEDGCQKGTIKTTVFVILGVLGVIFAVSLLFRPCLHERYMSIVSGCFVISFAISVFNVRGNKIILIILMFLSSYKMVYVDVNRVNKSVQPLFFQVIQEKVAPDDVIVASDWYSLHWLYYFFPDYDIRVLKGTPNILFKKKNREIEEKEILDLVKEKNVFVMTDKNFNLKVLNIFFAFDVYMQFPLYLGKLIPPENRGDSDM